jgi:hypothetical protein
MPSGAKDRSASSVPGAPVENPDMVESPGWPSEATERLEADQRFG